MSDRPQCGAPLKTGAPCKQQGPLMADGRCGWHSNTPEGEAYRERKREIGRQQAGKLRKPRKKFDPDEVPAIPRNLRDLKKWAAWVVMAIATGKLDKDTASKLVAALGELRRIIKEGEHADRIKAIEEKIKRAQQGKGA